MKQKVAIIILAAGASKRMGEPKQLLPWGEHTLLEHSMATVGALTENVYVVLGAHAKKIKEALPANTKMFVNPNWEKGLGNSIAFSVEKILPHTYDGVLFVLGDQPFVTSYYLQQMIDCFQQGEKTIVASKYENKVGVPAIFSSIYFDELMELEGDRGGKRIIEANQNELKTFPAENLVMDIDTPEVYKKAFQLQFGPK